MKNAKGNILITGIIIILIVLILGGVSFGIYKFFSMNKQVVNSNEFENTFETGNSEISGNETTNNNQNDLNVNDVEPIIQEPNNNAIPSETIATRYYYSQLDSYGKAIYDKLKDNKDQLKTGTYVFEFGTSFNTLLNTEKGDKTLYTAFQSAWNAFSYDECDLFYIDIKKMNLINETRTLGGITTYYVSIGPGNNRNYLQDSFQTVEKIEKAQNYMNNIIRQIVKQTKDDQKIIRAKKVHDWMIDAMEYDTSETNVNKYNIYGAIHDKKAVCEGYARSFKYIMEKVGVPCVLVPGTAENSQGKIEAHAWNYVQIDDKWYAVDVTWDDPVITGGENITDNEKYKFFLKGSEEFFKDHTQSGELSENSMIFSFPILSTINYEI